MFYVISKVTTRTKNSCRIYAKGNEKGIKVYPYKKNNSMKHKGRQ